MGASPNLWLHTAISGFIFTGILYLCVSVSQSSLFNKNTSYIGLSLLDWSPYITNYLWKSYSKVTSLSELLRIGIAINNFNRGKSVQWKVRTSGEVTLQDLLEIAQAQHAIFLRQIASSKTYILQNAQYPFP